MKKISTTLLIFFPLIILSQNDTEPVNEILDEFQNQWKELMSDYESQYVYIIPVAAKKMQFFMKM